MYFFSGEATCLNVMPACVVISVKPTFCTGEVTSARIKKISFSGIRVIRGSIAFRPRLFLQVFRDLQLVLAFFLSSGGDVGATQLVMNVRLIRLEFRGGFEVRYAAGDVALLQQRLAEFVIRVGVSRLLLNDFTHQLDAALSLLLG